MKGGTTSDVRCVSTDFLRAASKFYEVHECAFEFLPLDAANSRVLSDRVFRRPQPETMLIRIWMRSGADGDHLFRHIPEHPVPRVLSPSRVSKIQIS